jgi:hypothetical protein
VDLFTLANGKYSFPQPVACGDAWTPVKTLAEQCEDAAKPQWLCPGFDRPELYACPFTGHLYMTASVESGPYLLGSMQLPRLEDLVLVYAPNVGTPGSATALPQPLAWQLLKSDFMPPGAAPSVPLVMTSTPNGRLVLFYWVGDAYGWHGKLFCSGPGDAGQPTIAAVVGPPGGVDISGGDATRGYRLSMSEDGALTYVEQVNGGWVTAIPPDPDVTLQRWNPIPTPAISRASTDVDSSRVRVSLAAMNEYGRSILALVEVEIIDTASGPTLAPGSLARVGRIEAQDPKTHSVQHGTFIDPDYSIDTPAGVASNTSMFYWLDWPGRARTRQVACATDPKTADLNVLAVDANDGGLWHTVRRADGTWPDHFGNVLAAVPGPHIGPTTEVACATDPKTADLHTLAVDENGGLWHTVRRADPPGWPEAFLDVLGAAPSDPGRPGRVSHVACATNGEGDLHVLVVDANDGALWHAVRKATAPHWPEPWANLTGVFGAGLAPGDGPLSVRQVACATTPQGELHALALDANGDALWHTVRAADGTWPSPFVDVITQLPPFGQQAAAPGAWPGYELPAFQVSCASNLEGALHVLLAVPIPQELNKQNDPKWPLVQPSGGLWHLVRWADGSWFDSWPDAPSPWPIKTMGRTWLDAAACAVDGATGDLHVVALDNLDGLWHTLYPAITANPIPRSMRPDQEQVIGWGSDGVVRTRVWQADAGWGDWQALGAPPGGFVGWPTAVARSPQDMNIYVCGSNHTLWVRGSDGAWQTLGAPAGGLAYDPAGCSLQPNQESVFVRGSDGAIYTRQWQAGSSWGDWLSLGAPPGGFFPWPGGPALVARGAQYLNLFLRGADQRLWTLAYDSSRSSSQGRGWGGWQPLDAPPGGFEAWPAAVARSARYMNVYVCGVDHALWARPFDGAKPWYKGPAWGGWQPLGRPVGVELTTPIALSRRPDQEQVFVCGSDGHLYTREWVAGAGWGEWQSLGAPPGGFLGLPAAVARNPQCTNLYVTGSDHALWMRAYDGGWQEDWKTLNLDRSAWADVQALVPEAEPAWFPRDMSVWYCLVDGWHNQPSAAEALSVENGALRTFQSNDFGGDYLSGGYFYHNGHNYVAQWREPDGIRANILHVEDFPTFG